MSPQTALTAHRAFLPRDSKRDLTHLWRRKFYRLNPNKPTTHITEPNETRPIT